MNASRDLAVTKRLALRLLCLVALAAPTLLAPRPSAAQALWVEGMHYEVIRPAVPTSTPGKIEVVEVFSYGCPYCYQAQPTMDKLKAGLSTQAQLVLVPASFSPAEAFPMFQRAYLAAQTLGIADKTHNAMFEAIWKTGEFPLVDPATNRILRPLPTLADAARFYAHHASIKEADFMAAAQSFAVDAKVKRADDLVKLYSIPGTPAIVVNGKYRLGPGSAGGYLQMINLVNYLVAREAEQQKNQ